MNSLLYVQKYISKVNGKKSNSKLLETFEARLHVVLQKYANLTQRQDKRGTGKNPNGKI